MPIRSRIFLLSCFVCLLSASPARAELSLNGALRNDAAWLSVENDSRFVDLLENKWIIENQADTWRFYGDLRLWVLAGALSGTGPVLGPSGSFAVRIPRAFIRYTSDIGVFTLGKTYANFGIPGVFNPFEIDQSVNVTDLSTIKEGIVAVTWEHGLSDLAGLQAFAGPAGDTPTALGGLAIHSHALGFDAGLAVLRRGRDRDLAGFFFKGDLEVEVQGALAWHTDDQGENGYGEATAGLDYSFFDGEVLAGVQYTFQDRSAGRGTGLAGAAVTTAGTFAGRQYLYAWAQYVPDQFFQARGDVFCNLEDGSALVVPSATWVLADGLSATLLGLLPTGRGTDEYGPARVGRALDARVEAKF